MKTSNTEFETEDELQLLLKFSHKNPHRFLGLHDDADQKIIRMFRPGADQIHLEVFGEIKQAKKENNLGLFTYHVPKETTHLDYKIFHQNGLLEHDPYSFSPSILKEDIQAFKQGRHDTLYKVMGGRIFTHGGCSGARFTVWAPNARQISLVCDTNYFDGRLYPLREIDGSGIFEIFVPGLEEGEKYKFEIRTNEGHVFLKTDPFAFYYEERPNSSAILFDLEQFCFDDDVWHQKKKTIYNKPLNIYKVHLGSWKKNGSSFLNYRDLAHELVKYCQEMGYTHVETLPVNEHPLDESWGYQVTGFYSTTSRYGCPADFQYFVNYLHSNDIGVIIDFVPGHFPTDDFAIGFFDGTHLYEHSEMGIHPHWNTLYFDYAKPEVKNFLIASVLLFFDMMRVDGVRVDAVSSIIHLDFGKDEKDWEPNIYGGKENLDGLSFLKQFNETIHRLFPKAITIAEDTSSFQNVSLPIKKGGLGFDFKWNVGWCNDSMKFFKTESMYRHNEYGELLFSFEYLYTEKFIIPFSHDEVTHDKSYIIQSMPGEIEEKFESFKSCMGYMMTYPGKKLTFMGIEIAQMQQWYCNESLHWNLLKEPIHKKAQLFVKDLNHVYLSNPALYECDHEKYGFEWVVRNDARGCVLVFLRRSDFQTLLCIHHLMDDIVDHYSFPLPKGCEPIKKLTLLISSDDKKYGGKGLSDVKIQDQKRGVRAQLAPYATLVFEVEFEE